MANQIRGWQTRLRWRGGRCWGCAPGKLWMQSLILSFTPLPTLGVWERRYELYWHCEPLSNVQKVCRIVCCLHLEETMDGRTHHLPSGTNKHTHNYNLSTHARTHTHTDKGEGSRIKQSGEGWRIICFKLMVPCRSVYHYCLLRQPLFVSYIYIRLVQYIYISHSR